MTFIWIFLLGWAAQPGLVVVRQPLQSVALSRNCWMFPLALLTWIIIDGRCDSHPGTRPTAAFLAALLCNVDPHSLSFEIVKTYHMLDEALVSFFCYREHDNIGCILMTFFLLCLSWGKIKDAISGSHTSPRKLKQFSITAYVLLGPISKPLKCMYCQNLFFWVG